MKKTEPYIPAGSRLLDLGCHQGEMLFALRNKISFGCGIDPLCTTVSPYAHIRLIGGIFPSSVVAEGPFDTITALALVEHIPADAQVAFFDACYQMLKPNGILICTIPHRRVDKILVVLKALKLVKGMSLEEHHGFDIGDIATLATKAGFIIERHQRFQLGLNNLFVLRKSKN